MQNLFCRLVIWWIVKKVEVRFWVLWRRFLVIWILYYLCSFLHHIGWCKSTLICWVSYSGAQLIHTVTTDSLELSRINVCSAHAGAVTSHTKLLTPCYIYIFASVCQYNWHSYAIWLWPQYWWHRYSCLHVQF